MHRQEPLLQHRPLLCLKSWGWYVIGITAIPGYAMPPLRCMRSVRLDIRGKHTRSLTGCVVSLTRAVMISRSCTVFEVSATWLSGNCHISAVIAVLVRYVSGTGQHIKSKWMYS